MIQADIQRWLRYWGASSKGVTVDAIQSLEDVVQARRFCEVMRVGVFHSDLVSDLQIWRALIDMRGQKIDATKRWPHSGIVAA